jgi:dienelactone hydrolase
MRALLTAFIVLTFAPFLRAETQWVDPGSFVVDTRLEDWRDDTRDRVVPVKLYVPSDLTTPAPIVLVSHGLGGSREGLSYVARHWASHGFFVVVMQHPGSDRSVWEGKPIAQARRDITAAANPEQLINRVMDVKFVIDELVRRNALKGDALSGKLNTDRIAMTGHSFGAHTTLAVAGQRFPGNRAGPGALDSRIDCAIPFSPSDIARGDRDAAFGSIVIPVFHVTGTQDENPLDPSQSPESRQIPFQHSVRSDRCLLVLTDARHGTFGGGETNSNPRRRGGANASPAELLERHHRLVQQSTTAFLAAYLREDADAKRWLIDGTFANELGTSGTFEHRDPLPAK